VFSKLPGDLAAATRLFSLESEPDPIEEPSNPVGLASAPPSVAVDTAKFRYTGSISQALDGFSCAVAPGEHLGISGASGSGKSTVASAILRFIDLDSGRTVVGGTDVRRWLSAEVRKKVGALSADDHVFAGSIAANLAMALPDASTDEMWEALRTVRLEGLVESLPDQLATKAGENGSLLSGGERWRGGPPKTPPRKRRRVRVDMPCCS
jgi:ABC-type multidrug transport system fused ATPase/permease subunit